MNACCTYFDRNYLAPGLAMWNSLARHDPEAVLWVLALDADTEAVLQARREPRLQVVPLATLLAADESLAAVQSGRPRREFVFALTPCLLRWLRQAQPEIGVLAYLDADLRFFSHPAPIWRELGEGSVLVVPHRYPAWHDDAAWYGKFNVGVLLFRRDANGAACLEWWRERCLESTSLTGEKSCYGDQKYLDEWPRRFGGVVEAQHPGVNVAPWNWAGHGFTWDERGGHVDGAPLVVFHFAQFKRIRGRWFDSGQLEYGIMPRALRSRIYGEYWQALQEAEAEIRRAWPGYAGPESGWRAALGPWHLALLRLVWGQFWFWTGRQWLAGRWGLGRFSGRAMGWYRGWQRRRG